MSVLELTKDNFDATIASGDTLVDFWATWCGPCKMQGPVVEAYAEVQNTVKVGKVDVDQNMELATRYGIMAVPTLIAFRDGEVLKKTTGLTSAEEIEAMFR